MNAELLPTLLPMPSKNITEFKEETMNDIYTYVHQASMADDDRFFH